jgi:hypothetical protein
MTMTGPPGEPVTSGVSSLEVRWILPGPLELAVAEWFAAFPSAAESREDAYLLQPDMAGFSVKVRAGQALEVKAFGGSPGTLDPRDRVHGRLQYWRKWAFPFRPAGPGWGFPDGWTRVRKQRRTSQFALSHGRITEPEPARAPAGEPRCAVELTEIHAVHAHNQDWWSLGLEATGPGELLRPVLGATAAYVFARPLPPGVDLRLQDSLSYAEWLRLPLCITPCG